jgi:hypothetical protein
VKSTPGVSAETSHAIASSVSAETRERTDEERVRVLLADLLDWHRREDKPAVLASAECVGVLREHFRFWHLAITNGGRA